MRAPFPYIALFALVWLAVMPARADDWAVTRSDFDPRVLARYKGMLKRNAADAHALSQLVKLYKKHRTLAALIAEYKAAAKAAPGLPGPRYILGRLEGRAGRWTSAVAHFKAASALSPKSGWLLAAQAEALEKLGATAEALEAYQAALTLTSSPKPKRRYLQALAQLATTSGDHKRAAGYHQALLALSPKNREMILGLARAQVSAGNHAAALSLLKGLATRTGDAARKAELLKESGKVAAAMKKYDVAVTLFRKAMNLTAKGHWLRRELTDEIIEIYRKREALAELIKELEGRWKQRGAFEQQVLGRLYDQTGDDEKALAAYRAALKRAPHDVRIWLRVIALLDRSGRPSEAIRAYRRLTQVASGEPRHQLELAKRLHAQGKQKEALALLDRCGGRFPSDASVQSALSDLFARWGDQKRALARVRALVRLEPREINHLINLGEQYYLLGEKKRAMSTWARMLEVMPSRHAALARLAEVYAQHNLANQATTLYRKAIKLAPGNIQYQRALALVLEAQRQTTPAMVAWQKVRSLARAQKGSRARLAEREARAHVIKISRRTYQLRMMLRRLGQSLALGDQDRGDSLLLAEGMLALESLEGAAQVYRKLLATAPDDLELLQALERVLRKQRKLEEAVTLLKRLAILHPAGAQEYYQRTAELLLRLHRDKEATDYAHKAAAVAPRDAPTLVRLGQIMEKKEDDKAAVKAYQLAIQQDPGHVQAHFALARLSSRMGDPRRADALYRQVIGQARNPEHVRRAFRLGVTLASYLGTLEALERKLLPRALRGASREVFRELLVDVYRRITRPLIHQIRRGTPTDREAAAAALKRLGQRGLAPLLEELALESSTQEEIVDVLGYLGNINAVRPLLRIATREQEEVFIIRGTAHSRLRRIALSGRSGSGPTWSRTSRLANLRVAATVAAGRLSSQRAVPDLVHLMGSRDGPMRDAAAWALGRAASARGVKHLLNALGDSRVTVQVMACAGLGASKDPQMRPVLEEVMADLDRMEEVRVACAWGLGALGDKGALPRLLALVKDGDGELQQAAALALGSLGDRLAIPGLLEALWPRRSRVRRSILAALEQLERVGPGSPPSLAVPDVLIQNGRILLADFMSRLTSQSLPQSAAAGGQASGARADAIITLLDTHGDAVARGLAAALERHDDLVMRVLTDLDSMPGRAALGPITQDLARLTLVDQKRVEGAIQRACKPLAPLLFKLTGHKEPLIRVLALRVLAKLAPRRLTDGTRIQTALWDPDWRVSVAALDALGQVSGAGTLSPDRALGLTLPRLARGHWRQRERAASLAASLSGSENSLKTTTALVRAAREDPNGFVRQAAVLGLTLRPGEAAQEALVGALSDPASPVRAAACVALGQRGKPHLAPTPCPTLE